MEGELRPILISLLIISLVVGVFVYTINDATDTYGIVYDNTSLNPFSSYQDTVSKIDTLNNQTKVDSTTSLIDDILLSGFLKPLILIKGTFKTTTSMVNGLSEILGVPPIVTIIFTSILTLIIILSLISVILRYKT